MAAFYGTYAYLGDHVRSVHDAGAGVAALVPLAYGVGFGAAGVLDGRVDRVGPARLLLPTVLGLTVVHLALPLAVRSVAALLAVCLLWGLVNHAGLGMLVSLLGERGGTARGPVLALYSAATYGASAVATTALGPLYEARGLSAVGGRRNASVTPAAALDRSPRAAPPGGR
jgi:predicted MFS family arabinose efflux permease